MKKALLSIALAVCGIAFADTYNTVLHARISPTNRVVTSIPTWAQSATPPKSGADTNEVNALIAKYDETNLTTRINAKQDTLVSGTNIKTVNNQSLLGSGNIEIQGGGGTPSDYTTTNAVCNLITNNVAPWALAGHTEPQGMSGETATNIVDGIVASSNFVAYVEDFEGNKTAVTIDCRREGDVGAFSFVNGYLCVADGEDAHAEGNQTTASGDCSHSEGNTTTASGDCSHSEGNTTTASGDFSHAEGADTTASGLYSHAEGANTTASGECSHAEGANTTASGDCSHAEGESTTASGECSHAEGENTTASGVCSHAEGEVTTASGNYSHAEGLETTASDYYTHAEGTATHAEGDSSHAEGVFTHAGHSTTNESATSADYGIAAHSSGWGAWASNQTAFVWQGVPYDFNAWDAPETNQWYYDHGAGTYNINPVGGLSGFFVGEESIEKHIGNATNALAMVAHTGSYDDLSNKPTIPDAYTKTEADAAFATKADELATRAIVQTWEGFLDGSNVVFSITNYISGSYNLNAAKLRILDMTNGFYREVYNSRNEIVMHIDNFKTNDFRVATNQVITSVDTKIAGKADKAWGKYTSTGSDVIDVYASNTVYMTEPTTVFAGGTEYARFAVGEGSICILTTKGAPVYTAGEEGTFKFQDNGGTNYFGFARSDSYTIGANASGITVNNQMVTITYDLVSGVTPCIWYMESLENYNPTAWEQLNLPTGEPIPGASHVVSWEPNPPEGKRICYINVTGEAKGFFRATIEVAGSAKFITNMPADLTAGIVCTNTATGVNGVIVPSYNGSSVIWTWRAN